MPLRTLANSGRVILPTRSKWNLGGAYWEYNRGGVFNLNPWEIRAMGQNLIDRSPVR
jgi:hypothetical protein